MNDEFVTARIALAQKHSQQGLPREEIAEMLKDPNIYHSFFVPERARWESIRGLPLDIGPSLDKAFRTIEDEPKNSELSGVLTTANYNDKERVSDKKLSQLLVLFDSMQLNRNKLDNEDMLGDAYQYLIKEFADQGGSKGGEFYVPAEVVKTIVRILKLEEGDRIYEIIMQRLIQFNDYRMALPLAG